MPDTVKACCVYCSGVFTLGEDLVPAEIPDSGISLFICATCEEWGAYGRLCPSRKQGTC